MKELKVIAKIHNGFSEKFGIPRQSGLVDIPSQIVFEKEYRNPDALRGIEQYSHLWLLWEFTKLGNAEWSPTVRPPRLGGNERVGVFATRSPNRPNGIGLSSVRLTGVQKTEKYGMVLNISGADILDGTPIYDIKPYIKYTDCIENAESGFAEEKAAYRMSVEVPEVVERMTDGKLLDEIKALLAGDPRPSYQNDPTRVYGMNYNGFNVLFRVENGTAVIENIEKMP